MLDASQAEIASRGSVVAFRVSRDVVEASGSDAAAYLQGQLSQDVTALEVGASAWSLLLQPQGKVDAWLRLTRPESDRWLLDTDPGSGAAMVARLERFKLRMQVTFEPLAGWSMVALRGPGAADVARSEGVVVAEPEWPGVPGRDLLGPDPALPAGVEEGDPAAYDVLRICAGVPAMGSELDERTIPAEAGIVDRSASFTKGCYTGQELVARIDSRGSNTPRRLRGVLLDGVDVPAAGAEVLVDGAPVGRITSAGHSARVGVVALAYVKRAVQPPSPAEVGGVPARVVDLPIS